jgi:glycerol-3-phosphate cytidylyltransferase
MSVYIGGTYDILHSGHLRLFRWAEANFGPVTIGLNSDLFVERYKGKLPVMRYAERVDILLELRCVYSVIPNYGCEDSKPAILIAKPTYIVCGSDWTRERQMKQMGLTEEFLTENGITLVIFPGSLPIHSSDIKKRILEQ